MKKAVIHFLLILCTLLIVGCSSNNISNVPADFLIIMDVRSAGDFDGCAVNVNIRIDAKGRGNYESYDTDCAIEYDSNHMVTYQRSQVIEKGKFQLSNPELEQLWEAVKQNNFFDLTDDYHMAIGFSYAFIVVEADGRRHMVDNIGMELPELRAIVEAVDSLMPEGINLDYGEGFSP